MFARILVSIYYSILSRARSLDYGGGFDDSLLKMWLKSGPVHDSR